MLRRILQNTLEENLSRQKVTMLLGARRTGKTELLQSVFEAHESTTLWLNGEDMDTASLLEKRTQANYRRLLEGYTLLMIDEAQYIPDIAKKVKLMIDTIKPLHVILTGSSSFDLMQMEQPLVGRSITLQLFPLSQQEWKQQENALQTKQNLEDRLIYGSYPEISQLKTARQKETYLKELVNTYLLKDIFAFENIRNTQKIRDLLVLIAFQIGAEVSVDELGRNLGMSKNTVERYLDLLSKVFVLYSRSGYSGNLRKEVVKSRRWYFVDNGIRNAIINNFSPLATRQDVGALWEQYFLGERIKYNQYTGSGAESYFWRTYDQQEIDLVESYNGKLIAFECKWKKVKVKPPLAFTKAYPDAGFHVATQETYLDWI
jgi:predicted AAA+ superfamily ATPase